MSSQDLPPHDPHDPDQQFSAQEISEQESMQDGSSRCPLASILKVISAKWTVEILREVAIKPTRTRQFLALIPGLTMKCLQERLKVLESSGMISRTKYEEKVPRVEHRLTERGKRLLRVLMDLRDIAAETADINCICPMDLEAHQNESSVEAISFDCPTRRQPNI